MLQAACAIATRPPIDTGRHSTLVYMHGMCIHTDLFYVDCVVGARGATIVGLIDVLSIVGKHFVKTNALRRQW